MTFEDTSAAVSGARLASDWQAALDWWREAGLDYDYRDEAEIWLKPQDTEPNHNKSQNTKLKNKPGRGKVAHGQDGGSPDHSSNRSASTIGASPAAPSPAEAGAKLGGEPEQWPKDLAAFRDWWLTEPSLEIGGLGPRIAPRGEAEAALMVVVAQPEEQDRGALLSGQQGALISGMLRAMAIPEDQAYIASALPQHLPMADLASLDSRGLGAVLRRHIDLAAPKRLLVLGPNILPLIEHNMAQDAPVLRQIYQGALSIPVMVTASPVALLNRAANRAKLWQEWLDWTAPE